MTDTQEMTRVEGEALLEYLQGLPEESWDTQTVCDPWSVRHLVAHLTALGNQTMPNFAKRMVMTGFNFQKVVDGDLQKWRHPTATMLENFERSVANPSTPKILEVPALGEFMCHGEDIRRALGDRWDHPAAHVETLGPNYAKTGKPLNGKSRTPGLSFRATDSQFRFGEGPEIAGPGIDVIMAIAGRLDALDHCKGDGVPLMRAAS
ncbi:MAG: hypothetical protein ACI81L_002851 [Verrucomicrobiales bacterium]|jgi:uncharacterized protein (TIGR03083 family)